MTTAEKPPASPTTCPECGRHKKPQFWACYKCALCPQCRIKVRTKQKYPTCYPCGTADRDDLCPDCGGLMPPERDVCYWCENHGSLRGVEQDVIPDSYFEEIQR